MDKMSCENTCLDGKLSLIMGASGSIGEAISLSLAKMGSNLILSSKNINLLMTTKNKINEKYRNVNVDVFKVDVSKPDEIKDLGEFIRRKFGKIDIIVYNSGTTTIHHFLDLSLEEWEYIINVNLRGAFLLLKEFVPLMMEKRYGRIILISSIVGKTGGLGRANLAYTVSKAGLLGLTRNLAKFLAPYNITVNAIAPSFIESDMLKNLSYEYSQLVKMHPVGRIGTPDDVANVVAFLVRDETSFITGETINVNGGLLMD